MEIASNKSIIFWGWPLGGGEHKRGYAMARTAGNTQHKDRAMQCKARQHETSQDKARQGKTRQGKARQGNARQGKAGQGKARQGKLGQGRASLAKPSQAKTKPSQHQAK